jgi:hypothetical protein
VIGSNRLAASLSVLVMAFARLGHADNPSSDSTLAQTLFDEGVKLMDAGRFSEACPKLAESQRLDPGGGTLVNLGYCRQNEGKLASAWAAYNEALSQAIKDNRKDRENTARIHVDELEGKFARLAIDVSEQARRTPQIEIRIDGGAVRQAAWGVLSPIDRGEHGIVVTAPGKREYHTQVTIKDDGAVSRVAIPALEDAPVVVDGHERSGSERRGGVPAVVGWVTGAVGVAVLGVGVTTGIMAIDVHNQSSALCTFPGGQCTQKGFDLNEQSQTLAWLSDFGIGIGVAAIATGIVIIVTSPKSTAHVVPTASAHGAGAMFVTTF